MTKRPLIVAAIAAICAMALVVVVDRVFLWEPGSTSAAENHFYVLGQRSALFGGSVFVVGYLILNERRH